MTGILTIVSFGGCFSFALHMRFKMYYLISERRISNIFIIPYINHYDKVMEDFVAEIEPLILNKKEERVPVEVDENGVII